MSSNGMEEEEDITVIMDNSISRVEDTQKAGSLPLDVFACTCTSPAFLPRQRGVCGEEAPSQGRSSVDKAGKW
jgi:hypothetical protein